MKQKLPDLPLPAEIEGPKQVGFVSGSVKSISKFNVIEM